MKRDRSVSNDASPMEVVAPASIKWTIQGVGSLGERGRREQRIAWCEGTISVWTKRLLKAGWVASAGGGAITTSA